MKRTAAVVIGMAIACCASTGQAMTVLTFEDIVVQGPGQTSATVPQTFQENGVTVFTADPARVVFANATNALSSTALLNSNAPITLFRATPFRIVSVDVGLRESSTNVPGPYQGDFTFSGAGVTFAGSFGPETALTTVSFDPAANPFGATEYTLVGGGGPTYLGGTSGPQLAIDNIVIEDAPLAPPPATPIDTRGDPIPPTAQMTFEPILPPGVARQGPGNAGVVQRGISLAANQAQGEVVSPDPPGSPFGFLQSDAFRTEGVVSLSSLSGVPFTLAGYDLLVCGLSIDGPAGGCDGASPLPISLGIDYTITSPTGAVTMLQTVTEALSGETLRLALPTAFQDDAARLDIAISALFDGDTDRTTLLFLDNVGLTADGSLSIIPLPASVVFSLFGLGSFVVVARRRRAFGHAPLGHHAV